VPGPRMFDVTEALKDGAQNIGARVAFAIVASPKELIGHRGVKGRTDVLGEVEEVGPLSAWNVAWMRG